MPKLSSTGSRKLVKVLVGEGFIKVRQKGSHLRLEHPDGRKTTVPVHSREKIGKGLLAKILKDSNLPPKKLR